MRRVKTATVLALLALPLLGADRYTGPRPPKADLPYLQHADNLVETESGMASMETRKDATYAIVAGTTSKARTPLAEPIFLVQTNKFQADKFEIYKMELKDGKREVLVDHKKPKNLERPVHILITRLDDKLYRIEVDEPLENGEYVLTPQGSDDVFAFTIY